MLFSVSSIGEAQVFPQINPRSDNATAVAYDEGGEFNFKGNLAPSVQSPV